MLTVYLHDGAQAVLFRLVGEFEGESSLEFAHSWETVSSVLDGRRIIVDLAGVSKVDERGRELLRQVHSLGASFITASAVNDALVREISQRSPKPIPGQKCRWGMRLRRWFACCCRAGHSCAEKFLLSSPGVRKIW
jgi:anti-anti-sigma regulatory factor